MEKSFSVYARAALQAHACRRRIRPDFGSAGPVREPRIPRHERVRNRAYPVEQRARPSLRVEVRRLGEDEPRRRRKIACLEEIAYLNGWISREKLEEIWQIYKKNQYGAYLRDVMDGKYIDR